MRHHVLPALLALLALLLASACGTTEPAPGSAAEPAPGAAPITLTDGTGATITLPGPATRVVALEWNVAEHAASLGVMPVGVADPGGYAKWVSAEPLDPSVRDVGTRGEPSVDAIAALRPDLILSTDRLPDTVVAQLQRFAPVVQAPGGDAADPIGSMKRNLELVGRTLGKDAEATALNDGFDAKLADGRAKLAARAGQRVMVADGFEQNGQLSIRAFTDGSLLGAVATRLGLQNAWTEPGDATYGLARTDVEGLTRVGDVAGFVYLVNEADGGDPFRTLLGADPVWTSLPFVQAGQVDRLPDGIWMFGGPTSMNAYVDATVAALAP